jgi:hypothetical protein
MTKITAALLALTAFALVAAVSCGVANAGPAGKCHHHAGYTHCH